MFILQIVYIYKHAELDALVYQPISETIQYKSIKVDNQLLKDNKFRGQLV